MTLEHEGHSVHCVGNGAEAVKALQEAEFDVVLMDIQMPVMDGVTAVQKIRALPGEVRNIPVIALTADAMVGDREKYIGSGMNDYATKPIKPDDLRAIIKKTIGGTGTG